MYCLEILGLRQLITGGFHGDVAPARAAPSRRALKAATVCIFLRMVAASRRVATERITLWL